MDIRGTLLDIAAEIESGYMTLDGATSAVWHQRGFARDAAGDLVNPRSESAVSWCVFGHIKKREVDSIFTRDCFAAALVRGLPDELIVRVNAMEDAKSWAGAPFVSILRGFACRIERAAVGKTGDFSKGDYVASIMESVNDLEGLRAADVVGWLRNAAERHAERAAKLGPPAPDSLMAQVSLQAQVGA